MVGRYVFFFNISFCKIQKPCFSLDGALNKLKGHFLHVFKGVLIFRASSSKTISATDISINYFAIRQSIFGGIFHDSILKRYHQRVNEEQGRPPAQRNFYDEEAEVDPRSSELVGGFLIKCIGLLGYLAGPLYRMSIQQGNWNSDLAAISYGLPE